MKRPISFFVAATFALCSQALAGSVGRPYPYVECRLSEEGELLVRGPNVYAGYWRDPAATAAVFRDAEYFAINVLAAGDGALASHFAKPGADKFAPWPQRFSAGLGGAPLLIGALATFECHSRHRYYGGDHIVLIGVVERYAHAQGAPLAFHRGRYAALTAA